MKQAAGEHARAVLHVRTVHSMRVAAAAGTGSMTSLKNKRAAAEDTSTTLPVGITTHGSPAGS